MNPGKNKLILYALFHAAMQSRNLTMGQAAMVIVRYSPFKTQYHMFTVYSKIIILKLNMKIMLCKMLMNNTNNVWVTYQYGHKEM